MKNHRSSAAILIGAFVLALGGVGADVAEAASRPGSRSLLKARRAGVRRRPVETGLAGVITARQRRRRQPGRPDGRAYKDFEAEFKFGRTWSGRTPASCFDDPRTTSHFPCRPAVPGRAFLGRGLKVGDWATSGAGMEMVHGVQPPALAQSEAGRRGRQNPTVGGRQAAAPVLDDSSRARVRALSNNDLLAAAPRVVSATCGSGQTSGARNGTISPAVNSSSPPATVRALPARAPPTRAAANLPRPNGNLLVTMGTRF